MKLVGHLEWIRTGKRPDGTAVSLPDSARRAIARHFGVKAECAERPKPTHKLELPCVHLGEQNRTEICNDCGRKGVPAAVFSCSQHGECTLRKFKKSGVKSVCLTCPDYRAAERSVMTWAVGITTAPRENPTIETTLRSVHAVGWMPLVYAEPDSPLPADAKVVQRKERLGAWRNWVKTAEQLLSADTSHVLIVQDDVELCPDARRIIEEAPWPADVGCRTLYTSSRYHREGGGLHEIPTGNFWGACALAFPSAVLRRMVDSKIAKDWRGPPLVRKKEPVDVKNIDTAVGKILESFGLRIEGWSPSLGQHIGDTSTVSKRRNEGGRLAKAWRGEPRIEVKDNRLKVAWFLSDLAKGGIATYVANVMPGLQDDHRIDASAIAFYTSCRLTNYDLARKLSHRAWMICTSPEVTDPQFKAERAWVEFRSGQAAYDPLIDECDVVTCASNNPDVLARTDWRGKPLLVQLHSTCEWTRKIALTLRPYASHYLVTSQEARRFAIGVGIPDDMLTVIELAVDLNRIASWKTWEEARAEFLSLSTADVDHPDAAHWPWILFYGRFAPEKRVPLIARAIRAMNARGRPAIGIFGGDGWTYEKDAAAIKSILPGHHIMVPWAPRVGDLHRACDVFVCASKYEGGPTTAIESLCAGMPIVSGEFGILPSVALARRHAGPARPVQITTSRNPSPEELADAIEEALSVDPDESAFVAMEARGRFSLSRMADEWARVVRKVAGGAK